MWWLELGRRVFGRGCTEPLTLEPVSAPSPDEKAAPQEEETDQASVARQLQLSRERQQAAAEKLGRPVAETNSIGMQLVLIPAGEFMMGRAEAAGEAAKAFGVSGVFFQKEHRVRLTKSFYLGVHEVTQEQYERVMGVKPSDFKRPQHPVVNVNWIQAVKFCDKLSALPEEQAARRAYRLPTEAEWEYACRAGTTTRYSFGDDSVALGDYAWFADNSDVTTHPVGEKRPNAWGLYDMYGNAWEWCADWNDEGFLTYSLVDDPAGPATGFDRVYRGGSFNSPASYCQSASRRLCHPYYWNSYRGFRVAAVLSASQAIPASPESGAMSDNP